MKTRTIVCLTVAAVGYGAFLHAAKARGQGEPVAPVLPMEFAMPTVPAMPAMPAVPASPIHLAMPRMPEMPALAAMPEIPAVPAIPDLSSLNELSDLDEMSVSVGYRHDGPAESCDDLRIRLRDEKPTMEQEERSVSKAQAKVLRVHPMRNSGAQVIGWDKDTYSVTACKAAIGSNAQSLLSQIKLKVEGGEVSVEGPSHDGDDWTVYLLVRTPKSADVELTTHNGPASFYNVDGKITARAENGPISMDNCSGEADVAAVNGPVSFSGVGGKLRLHTENGPISVAVGGSSWTGGGLVADAVNGPLSLHVPSGFQSAFLVESSEHAPMSCHASICSETRRTWDDEHRRIEYGSGTPVIRLSTRNGPISVD
jgi:hypothetical protein